MFRELLRPLTVGLVAVSVAMVGAACTTGTATPSVSPSPAVAANTAVATVTPTAVAPTAAPTASPTPTSTPTASPVPTPLMTVKPTPLPTAKPTPTKTPKATPFPSGAPGALAAVKAYENYLTAAKYQQAWTLLGPGAKSTFSSFSSWMTERQSFLTSSGTAYTAQANPSGVLPLADWVNGQPWAAEINLSHAVLVKVDWTKLAGDNAGWEMWVVTPTNAGVGWALYPAR